MSDLGICCCCFYRPLKALLQTCLCVCVCVACEGEYTSLFLCEGRNRGLDLPKETAFLLFIQENCYWVDTKERDLLFVFRSLLESGNTAYLQSALGTLKAIGNNETPSWCLLCKCHWLHPTRSTSLCIACHIIDPITLRIVLGEWPVP